MNARFHPVDPGSRLWHLLSSRSATGIGDLRRQLREAERLLGPEAVEAGIRRRGVRADGTGGYETVHRGRTLRLVE